MHLFKLIRISTNVFTVKTMTFIQLKSLNRVKMTSCETINIQLVETNWIH